jgi:hypothetical protein
MPACAAPGYGTQAGAWCCTARDCTYRWLVPVQAIDARVRLHDPLLRLHGRLGLVLHHTRDAVGGAAQPLRPGPEVGLGRAVEGLLLIALHCSAHRPAMRMV